MPKVTERITDDDGRFMRLAIGLAKKGIGRTSPNPAVGAVVVKNGRVVSTGWHKKAGGPHAEASALSQKGVDFHGASLYVTLEPCCHWGKTPPCTDVIIGSGIKKVFFGARDPNPLVSGKGAKALMRAGIDVVAGVLGDECRALNPAFNKFIVSRIPYVTLKLAATLDGRIATSSSESRWITGPESRRTAHALRAASDAVMAGRTTVERDNPELTVRLARGANPTRVVLDTSFKTPLTSKIFLRHPADRDKRPPVVFTTGAASKVKIAEAKATGIRVEVVRKAGGGADVKDVLKRLGAMGVTSVLVEGGGELSASLLRRGLVDSVCWFVAPKIIGNDGVPAVGFLGVKTPADAICLVNVRYVKTGDCLLVRADVARP